MGLGPARFWGQAYIDFTCAVLPMDPPPPGSRVWVLVQYEMAGDRYP